jgi:uncharacterized coiled-coil DUF342 family protein
MSHQIQMNKMLQEQNMSHQIQMNKHIQYIREDFQNKIKLVNNELTITKNELTTTKNKLKEVYNKIEKMNNSYEQSIQSIKEVKNDINDLKLHFKLNVLTEDKFISLINKIIEIINTMSEEVWKNKDYLNNQIKNQNNETKSLEDEILFLKKKINDLQGIIIGRKLIKILLKKIIDNCFERIFLSSDFIPKMDPALLIIFSGNPPSGSYMFMPIPTTTYSILPDSILACPSERMPHTFFPS